MSWNHRVIAHQYEGGEVYFHIHEVYYDHNKIPNGYTRNPVVVSGEDLKSIKWNLNKMKECLKKPILKAWDFPNEYEI